MPNSTACPRVLLACIVASLIAVCGDAHATTYYGYDPGLYQECAWTPEPGQRNFFADTTTCPSANGSWSSSIPHWVLWTGDPCGGPSAQQWPINTSGSPVVLSYSGGGCSGCACNPYAVDMKMKSSGSNGCGLRADEYFGMVADTAYGPFPTFNAYSHTDPDGTVVYNPNFFSHHEILMVDHSGEQHVDLDLNVRWTASNGTLKKRVIGLAIPPYSFWDAVNTNQFPNTCLVFVIPTGGVEFAVINAECYGYPRLCSNGVCGTWQSYDVNWASLFQYVQSFGYWNDAPPLYQLAPTHLIVSIETFDGGEAHIQHRNFRIYSP